VFCAAATVLVAVVGARSRAAAPAQETAETASAAVAPESEPVSV
jgi:hypothetical protein